MTALGKVGTLVVDTNALIAGGGFLLKGDSFCTVAEVLQEVRDRKTREFVENLPVDLVVKNPSEKSLLKVFEASRRTGDYGVLSKTDLKVLALAYEEAEAAGCLFPPKNPYSAPQHVASLPLPEGEAAAAEAEAAKAEAEIRDRDGVQPEAEAEAGHATSNADVDAEKSAEEEESDDGAGEWVTPENLSRWRARELGFDDRLPEPEGDYAVGIVTTDFPMQNVALQMGLVLVSIDARRIRGLKKWILRCHGCFTVVTDVTRQFCPACGSGDTLKRVSYEVDAEGNMTYFVNYRRPIRVAGTRRKLPKPTGGRNGTNRTLVLREDQLRHCGRTHHSQPDEVDRRLASVWDEDWQFATLKKSRRVTHSRPTLSNYKARRR